MGGDISRLGSILIGVGVEDISLAFRYIPVLFSR